MNTLPTLLTSHLVLRPLRTDDAQQIALLAGNLNVARNTRRIPHPYSEELARDFIAEQRSAFNKGQEWTWAICLKDGLTLVGCAGVLFEDEMSAELGYWLGERYWNHGYASEAGRAVIDHVFNTCTLWEMNARHLLSNAASGRVLGKLGFQMVGFTRGTCREAGQDIVLHRLLHAAWVATPEGHGFA